MILLRAGRRMSRSYVLSLENTFASFSDGVVSSFDIRVLLHKSLSKTKLDVQRKTAMLSNKIAGNYRHSATRRKRKY